MKIISDGKKFFIRDYTPKESMSLKRQGVNLRYDNKYNCIVAEDNIFNRILLDLNTDFLLSDINVDSIIFSEYLRDYQVKDLKKMLKYKNILNRNKMGYGKTLEAIEYCKILNLNKILVLCPKSVICQWQGQFSKWWPESVSSFVDKPERDGCAQIYITNYETLDNTKKYNLLKNFTWDIIICDESHRIKNRESKRTQKVKLLPTIRKMALTGTPILNKPDDLWSQLNWLGVKYSGSNYWAFTERFCEIEEDNWGKKPLGLTPSDQSRSLLSKALNLITVGGDNHSVTLGINRIDIKLEMSKEQNKLYKDIKRLALDTLNEQGITIKNGMDQFIKMQQVTTNTNLFGDIKNPKFEWVKDWLEDCDSKVIVFSKFTETLKELQKYLGKDTVEIYHGKLSLTEREHIKKKFISGDCRVLAGTIGALGVGTDGLQEVCNNVIFLDRDWSPAINDQAESRIDRSGQKKVTNVYILKMRGTIDEYVEQIINHKNDDVKELCEWIKSWC